MRARRSAGAKAGFAESAAIFFALGDETRLGLVSRLCDAGPTSIAKLTQSFDMTRQAITKHLQFLAVASIIEGKRAGREHVWALNPARLAEAQRCLEMIARGWDDALVRLKRQLEEG